MDTSLNYLELFTCYCKNEKAFNEFLNKHRTATNFKLIMKNIDIARKSCRTDEDYANNLKKSIDLVNKFSIVHNTSLDNLLGIIKSGYLFSRHRYLRLTTPDDIWSHLDRDCPDQYDYVVCGTESDLWIYGMYEIRFKRLVENLANAKFLPQSASCYNAHEINDYLMDIKDWRSYLSAYITTNLDNVNNYLSLTPFHKRPEFLFPDYIPIEYIEEIRCATKKAYLVLQEQLDMEPFLLDDLMNPIRISVNKIGD